MNCRDFQELLSAHIDGELSAEETECLRRHIRECSECRQVLNELSLVKSALSSLPEIEISEDLHDKVMAAIAAETESSRSPGQEWVRRFEGIWRRFARWGFRQWAPVLAGAMVLVIAISAGGLWLSGTKDLAPNLAVQPGEEVEQWGLVSQSSEPPAGDRLDDYGGSDASTRSPSGSPDMGTASLTKSVMDRKIVRNAVLNVEVSRGKVREAAQQAMSIVQVHFGYIEQSSMAQSTAEDDFSSFYMTARVPSGELDSTMEELAGIGRVKRQDTSSSDITDQYVDLDARLRNKIVQEERLLKIIGEAKSVGELLQVEGELSRVRGDIESMQAQINHYDKSVAMASLSFTAMQEGSGVKPPSPWGDIWRTFVNAWRNVLLVAARSAPGIITLGALGTAAFLLVRRRQRA
ncbi:MAG: DUF4349 domain-containing protein [Bacillota bacterium]